MPRPKRCRKVCSYPKVWSFVPEGGEPFDTVDFMLDEYETIRLIDHEKLTQEECAAAMGVSRVTVTNIYESARFKLSEALINGKRLRITGGTYFNPEIPSSANIKVKGDDIMRIAVTYENDRVGQHFGRTEQFKIYDIADGKIKDTKIIDTNGTGHGALAGFLRAAEVQTLICGGIGMGARNMLGEVGIEILPGVDGVADEVVGDYLAGSLSYDPNTECHHHDHEHGDGCHGEHEGGGCHGGGCHQ